MASTGPAGYPDWQRVQNWDGPVLYTKTGNTFNTSEVSPVLDVSRYAYVCGADNAVSGSIVANYAWYADQAATQQLGARSYVVSDQVGISAQLHIPNMGPYLQVTWTPWVPGSVTRSGKLFASNRYTPLDMIPRFAVLRKVVGRAIANGVTDTWWLQDYHDGAAVLWANPNGIALTFTLFERDTNGLDETVWQVPPMTQLSSAALVLPATACYLQVANNSGGAATYSMTLTASYTGSS